MDRHTHNGRLAIIAGSGRLPLHVAEAARRNGDEPLIIALDGESDLDWTGYDHDRLDIGNVAGFHRLVERYGIDRIVLSGGVRRRPGLSKIRLGWASLKKLPGLLRDLNGGGDNKILTTAIGLLETPNCRVIGVHDIAPDLLAQIGPLGQYQPDERAGRDIAAAVAAARLLGRLDIGQGAVAVGGRVVALEGPEGTDAMLDRVAEMKRTGRIAADRKGVLVKLCKPGQDARVDLPSAGIATIDSAARAGLSGVALEAGRALVLDRAKAIAAADRAGLFLMGIEPEGGEP